MEISKVAIMQHILSILECLGTAEKGGLNSLWRESGNVFPQ